MGTAPGRLSVPSSWDLLPLRGQGQAGWYSFWLCPGAGGGSFVTFPGESC